MSTLCYDIGGTKILCAVIDDNGNILAENRVPTPTESWAAAKKVLIQLADDFRKKFPDIKKCGIGSAGPLDVRTGAFLNPTNMNWGTANIRSELKRELNLPVAVDNDAATAVMGEARFGNYKGSENLVMITLGTGLGVGLIKNNILFRSADGQHPELGHQIIDVNSCEVRCACGNPGCAEGFLAGSHFLQKVRQLLFQPELSADETMRLAKLFDPTVLRQFSSYALYLAQFIYNLGITFGTEKFLIAGGFAKTSPFFLADAQKLVHQWSTARKQPTPTLELATLKNPILFGAYSLAEKL